MPDRVSGRIPDDSNPCEPDWTIIPIIGGVEGDEVTIPNPLPPDVCAMWARLLITLDLDADGNWEFTGRHSGMCGNEPVPTYVTVTGCIATDLYAPHWTLESHPVGTTYEIENSLPPPSTGGGNKGRWSLGDYITLECELVGPEKNLCRWIPHGRYCGL